MNDDLFLATLAFSCSQTNLILKLGDGLISSAKKPFTLILLLLLDVM